MTRQSKNIIRLLCMAAAMFLFQMPSALNAQAISDEVPASWRGRIKLIDQFMSRFNGTDRPEGSDPSDPQFRIKLMASTFDFNYLNSNQDFCMQFITDMITGGYKLDFGDTTWYAITECKAEIRGVVTTLTIVLRTEKDRKGLYKWVIYNVQGEELEFQPSKTSSAYKISPADNEVDFIHLPDITSKDRDLILNYSSDQFQMDQTSVFFTLVATEQLRIMQINSLIYQFEKGQYRFTVSRFNRENTNSGWLINNISKK